MVINNSPKREEKPEISESEQKEKLLKALSEESYGVISLAYMFAKNFETFGEDVTRRWQNAILQTDALNRAYKKGVDDTLIRMRSKK